MDTLDLAAYLMQNRAKLANAIIVDCLHLAHQTRKRGRQAARRFPVWQMCDWFGCGASSLSKRLTDLHRAGLLDYERGTKTCPGYLIRRIGPAPEPQQRATVQKPHRLTRS